MENTGKKRFLGRHGLAAVFALGALFASATAMAGIANTKHNLGSGGAAGQNKVSETDEICVFCHTPHGGDTSNPAPLWNKRLNTGGTAFTTYESIGSSTMNARFASDGLTGSLSVGSVSLACLSCHDGTQAMDNIINAPGSGGLTAGGGGAAGLTWTWGTSPRVDAAGTLTGIAALGKDLSNDHPIGIQYCGGGPTVAATGAACRDGDFVTPTSGSIGGGTVFWVDSGTTAGSRDKADMILYNRTFPTDGAGPSVECATCHDPHSEDTATKKTFLRIANTGSAVCLACHVK